MKLEGIFAGILALLLIDLQGDSKVNLFGAFAPREESNPSVQEYEQDIDRDSDISSSSSSLASEVCPYSQAQIDAEFADLSTVSELPENTLHELEYKRDALKAEIEETATFLDDERCQETIEEFYFYPKLNRTHLILYTLPEIEVKNTFK
jgi:vacuolar-type H+-ATPase subunit I/STV1